MENPSISVIVPVYNVEKYLPKCIDSILQQSYSDFELILVDDGSPDNCGAICDEYARKDERIRVFHQENAGLSCARNLGLKNSIGEYIAFVDSDDYVKPNYLRDLYEALPRQNQNKGLIIGSFDRIYIDKVEPFTVPERIVTPKDFSCFVTEFINKRVMYAWSKLFSRELIQNNNLIFIPGVSGLEDMLFTLDYCLYANYVIIKNFNNYCYRVAYSSETLSMCINPFPSELLGYREYIKRLRFYRDNFLLEDADMMVAWKSLTVFLHKVILAIYKLDNGYSSHERKQFLRELLSENRIEIRKYFFPDYMADKVGKYLLLGGGVRCFDTWMRFLIAIGFKKMFGYNE